MTKKMKKRMLITIKKALMMLTKTKKTMMKKMKPGSLMMLKKGSLRMSALRIYGITQGLTTAHISVGQSAPIHKLNLMQA